MAIKRVQFNITDDYYKVISFLVETSKVNKYLYWTPGRMNFWRNSVHGAKGDDDNFFINNVMLWKDNDTIVGLAISEYGKNDIFVETKVEYEYLYKDIFSWIEYDWASSKDQIEFDVIDKHSSKIETLKELGYSFTKHTESLRFYDLKNELPISIRDGYKVEAFYLNKNYSSRVELVKSAFNNDSYSEKNVKSIETSKDYIKELDLGIISPSGQMVAYCIGWRSNGTRDKGYIEPVGTHADFRRMGLASNMIKTCFNKMYNLGIKEVNISSYAEPDVSNFLYDSLNPREMYKIFQYTKIPSKG